MKRRLKHVFAMAMALGAGIAQAGLVTLEDQATIAASDATLYKATNSVAVKLTGEAVDGVYTFKSGFNLEQGVTVTFDTSEVTGSPTTICMKGSLRGAGKLSFGSGITVLKFGGGNNGDSAVSRSNILHLPVFEGDVVFSESTAKVIFQIGVSVVNWPSVTYEFADDVVLGLFGENLFTSDFTLNNFDIDLMSTNSTAAGITITVPEGRRIYHRAGSLAKIKDSSTSLQTWEGCGYYIHNQLNIVLAGGTIQMQDRGGGNVIPANVTGTGTIDSFVQGGSCCIEGLVNYSGKMIHRDGRLAGWISFKLSAGSSLENVDFSCTTTEGEGRIKLACAEPVTVKSLAAPYAARVWVTAGSEVTINAISGKVTFDGVEDAGGEVILPNVGTTQVTATDLVTLTLSGSQTATKAIEAVHVAIAEGADIHCDFGSALASIENRGGTLTETEAWRDKVALWTDASDASTFVDAKTHLATCYPDKVSAVKDAQMFEWKDVRPTHRTYALRVSKYDTAGQTFNALVFPYLDSAPNMVRFPQNKKARMTIAPAEYGKTLEYLSARCVIAVFSATLGGGFGMFCEKDGRLKRTETVADGTAFPVAGDPILLDDTVLVRTNGVAVTGSETGFTGDWQIITLTHDAETNSLLLRGISHPSNNDLGYCNGGQEFAEILIFDELPTDYEIVQAEKYLARKWNQAVASNPARNLTITGTGTMQLDGDIVLSAASYYRGALTCADGSLTLPAGKVPMTDAEVPANGRTLWVDPAFPDAVQFSDDAAKPDEIKYIHTRDNEKLLTGDGAYYVVSPYNTENTSIYDCNRRVRSVDGWLDFSGGYTDEQRGNMMAVRTLPYEPFTNFTDSVAVLSGIKGGCMALDTSRNGGSFMLSVMNGGSGDLQLRSEGGAAKKIWVLGSSFTGTVDTYLDGTEVDGLKTPFNKRKETLSFNVSDDDFTVKCFGYLDSSRAVVTNREIMGEWMLYDRNLTEDERTGIESYLMKKWQGTIRAGYCETRDMTIAGSGDIVLNSIRQLPKLASGFSGKLTAQDATLAFTVADGASRAKDAISAGDHELAFTQEVTVNVTVGSHVVGTVTLIDGALDADAAFTLGTVTGTHYACALRKTDDGLYLDVSKRGLLFLVR